MSIEDSPQRQIHLQALITTEHVGKRFDQAAADLFPDYSRGRIQSWIKDGFLTLDGNIAKSNRKLVGGESLSLNVTLQAENIWEPENIPLNIVYEDADILVLNKPANFVVHPAAGNWSGTVLNALLFHVPALAEVPRAGIVHRLDKDTSGLMVVAKTIEAQSKLVQQLQSKSVYREYFALVLGQPNESGKVEADIGRHPTIRTKMAVLSKGGKPAVTHFERIQTNGVFSAVKLRLETGRTHQIRVHMAHLGFPLVGDPVYGKSISNKELKKSPELAFAQDFDRQALHARKLGLVHPATHETIEFESPLAEDLLRLNSTLFSERLNT